MRAPASAANTPLFDYTLMPTHMRNPFDVAELQDIQLAEPFAFTKGCRTMKLPGRLWVDAHQFGTLLFDTETDPKQEHPMSDPDIEAKMIDHLVALMREGDAPREQYQRIGLGQ